MNHEGLLAFLTALYEAVRFPSHKHGGASGNNNNIETIIGEEIKVQGRHKVWLVSKDAPVTFYRKPSGFGSDAICTIFDYEGQQQITVYSKKLTFAKLRGKQPQRVILRGPFQ